MKGINELALHCYVPAQRVCVVPYCTALTYCPMILQENNAMAIVDVRRAIVTGVYPLGFKDHRTSSNSLDPSDRDSATGAGAVRIGSWPVSGMFMPDEIRSIRSSRGRDYVVTANEGDARPWDGEWAYGHIGKAGAITTSHSDDEAPAGKARSLGSACRC
jgi:hypothetical protein